MKKGADLDNENCSVMSSNTQHSLKARVGSNRNKRATAVRVATSVYHEGTESDRKTLNRRTRGNSTTA